MSSESPFPQPPGSDPEYKPVVPPVPSFRPLAPPPGAGENLPIRPAPSGPPRKIDLPPTLFTTPPSPQPKDQPPRFLGDVEIVNPSEAVIQRRVSQPVSPSSPEGNNEEEEKGPSLLERATMAGRAFKRTIEGVKEHPLYARFTVPVRLAAANFWLGREAKAYKKSERKHRDAKDKAELWRDQADFLEDSQRDLVGAGFSLRNDKIGKRIEKARGRSNRFADKAEDAEGKLIEKRSSVEVKAEVRDAVADEMLAIYDQGASKIQDKIESFERKSGLAGVRHELASAEIKLKGLENSLAESKRKADLLKKKYGNQFDSSEARRIHSEAEKAIEKAKKIKDKLTTRKNSIDSRIARLNTKKTEVTSKKDQLQRAIDGNPFNVEDDSRTRSREERSGRSGDRRTSGREATLGSEGERRYRLFDLVGKLNDGLPDALSDDHVDDDFYTQALDRGSFVSIKDFSYLIRSYMTNIKGVRLDEGEWDEARKRIEEYLDEKIGARRSGL